MRYFVCDVCDTLYRSNTTFDFVRFALERGPHGRRRTLERAVNARHSPLFYAGAVFFRLGGPDVARFATVALLRGFSQEELASLAESFVDDFLASRRIEETHRLVEEARDLGERVVLVSASLEPVVAAIAARLRVEHRASELEVDPRTGRLTGRISRDWTGRKQAVLGELGWTRDDELTVMTDNFSDAALMELADRRLAVVHSARAEDFWQRFRPQLLRVG